jgi:uncharacterized membrane protein
MKITVENFRGIAKAVINATSRVILIAAPNHSGKTSIMQAASAALTGNALPIPGLTKSHASRLVKSGSGAGYVAVATETGTSDIRYPECTVSTTKEPPTISEYAAGLNSIVDVELKKRANIVSEVLHTLPDMETTTEAFKTAGVSDKVIERIIKTIASNGWDAAHAQAKEAGTKSKGAWEAITHTAYGAKKAESYLPDQWEPDLDGLAEAQLVNIYDQEKEWLEVAISDSAVSSAEIANLESTIACKSTIIAEFNNLKKERADINAESARLKKIVDGIPNPDQVNALECPACGDPLQLKNGKLHPYFEPDPEEAKANKQLLESTVLQMRECVKRESELADKLSKLDYQIKEILNAEQKILEIKAKPRSESTRSVEDCRARVQRACDRLNAFRQKTQADVYHKAIVQNAALIEILAPNGLRQEYLTKKIDEFNQTLKTICVSAGWKTVEFRTDMSITLSGTPYMLLSESEQFRVRVVLQIAFAKILDDEIILIDRADILDGAGRNGLFKALLKSGITAIVAMTIDKKELVPDIKKINGLAYWIENSEAVEI